MRMKAIKKIVLCIIIAIVFFYIGLSWRRIEFKFMVIITKSVQNVKPVPYRYCSDLNDAVRRLFLKPAVRCLEIEYNQADTLKQKRAILGILEDFHEYNISKIPIKVLHDNNSPDSLKIGAAAVFAFNGYADGKEYLLQQLALPNINYHDKLLIADSLGYIGEGTIVINELVSQAQDGNMCSCAVLRFLTIRYLEFHLDSEENKSTYDALNNLKKIKKSNYCEESTRLIKNYWDQHKSLKPKISFLGVTH